MNNETITREAMSIKEAMVSTMQRIAGIVEVLERKGLCAKQDLHNILSELRRKNPRADIPETVFPEPYLLTDFDKIIEMGLRVAKGTTH